MTQLREASPQKYPEAEVYQEFDAYYLSRALMDRFNSFDILVEFLLEEVQELNGRAKTGEHSKLENREDYRMEEVSDIIAFSMGIFRSLNLEPDHAHISYLLERNADNLDIDLVPIDSEFIAPAKSFDNGQESGPQQEKYQLLKARLNEHARALKILAENDADVSAMVTLLENILATAYAVHHLIGNHHVAATREKIARNHVKYPAHMFSQWWSNLAEIAETPEEERAMLKLLFNQQRRESIRIYNRNGGDDDFFFGKEKEYEEPQNPQLIGLATSPQPF